MKIAIFMTCHNRCEKTLACLTALYFSINNFRLIFEVYLVDDGSTDQTSNAVRDTFPDVHVIAGDGSLFWAGGMRKAFEAASSNIYDYYLWLNDDTILYPLALKVMLESYEKAREIYFTATLVVGSVVDPETKEITYGGRVSRGGIQPLYYDFVFNRGEVAACDTINGNCVLIPREIVEGIGWLDPVFTHGKADYDYGLRAKQAGYTLVVASDIVGECARNIDNTKDKLTNMSVSQRWKFMKAPKNYPLYEWYIYTRRHTGFLWPIHWVRPYLRIIFKK